MQETIIIVYRYRIRFIKQYTDMKKNAYIGIDMILI